jgi:hypothetical protein
MRPHPRGAETDPTAPRAWATCDACGFVYNLYKLNWRMDWRGNKIENLRLLVCETCLDEPQRQLGTVILPPDPAAIMNARPENYAIDEATDVRVTMDGNTRVLMNYPNPSIRETIGN